MTEHCNNNLFTFFAAHIIERQNELRSLGKKIVHYTRAETCLSIINGREFWLRNTQCMNDYQEVEFGIDQIIRYFEDKEKSSKFWDFLEKTHSGLSSEITQNFDGWLHDLRSHTYITCLSEHPAEEDSLGRLSM